MIDEYKEELKKLKERMALAEKFAEKLPCFRDYIIKHKQSGKESFLYLGDNYKKLHLAWGIKRYLYKAGSKNITNYEVTIDGDINLYCLYINSYSMFDRHESYGLQEAISELPIFYFDKLNTTIYVEEHNLEAILETLNVWYIEASKQNSAIFNEEKLEKARNEVKRLEGSCHEVKS
tara:strand:+ start:1525 stop:2055 length:531 start_codon:yes stop_codon:yes gene_type:complete